MSQPTWVLKLASRARELFESSEVDEKRQLLNFVFQNLQLKDVSLSVQVREPFNMMMDYDGCPNSWRWRDSNSRPKATPNPSYYMLSALKNQSSVQSTPQ